jgi:thioesterase domain-containing protein
VSVAAFLAELRGRDIQVWLDGDQLRCNAPAGVLTPDLQSQLRQRKSEIVEFLRSAEALARQERAIVPLQAHGERTPIFGVPGHNGDVFCYRALAQHLGDEQPFFGLQPPGVDGHSEPLACIEELAAYFATQIRAFRPDGPYVIVGYCAGGPTAFELARHLLQNSASISFVGLFAPSYPTTFRVLPQQRQRLVKQVERAIEHTRALAALPNGERRRYISEMLRNRMELREQNRLAASDPVMIRRARVQDATVAGVRRYTPQNFAGRVSLFLPNRKWLRSADAAMRWRGVAQEIEQYCGPDDCEGDLMLLDPSVVAIAELFRRCCQKSEASPRVLRQSFPEATQVSTPSVQQYPRAASNP